jgi:hypothetical protein
MTNRLSEPEEFRPWPGDRRYLVGNHGTIIGPKGRPLTWWLVGTRPNYRAVKVPDGRPGRRRQRNAPVHVMVCEAWHGPKPTPRHQAAHGNGDPADNRAVNLRWATPEENQADAKVHGTCSQGERHPSARLTEDQVREILHAVATGPRGTRAAMARKYGIHPGHVTDLVAGKKWAHLDRST